MGLTKLTGQANGVYGIDGVDSNNPISLVQVDKVQLDFKSDQAGPLTTLFNLEKSRILLTLTGFGSGLAVKPDQNGPLRTLSDA
ncbi:hypothetical protein Glove_707g29 [Diversispora epigaea]|uniref:Uncharacterized protein n=1 Tax=Diversispora epigaea TaxID=1348612 RepID=A0A397G1K5_9GLOM|nr:hypothetical protein Glove_707g29 [Diversispora epigaea]